MFKRLAIVVLGLMAGVPAFAQELKPEEARQFIAGKLFAFNCFEGTRGAGRIYADGSVSGSVQFGGSGPVRNVRLPAGTLQVKPEAVCASMRGLPFQPCFNLQKIDQASFRGSISGLGFAYCEFNRKSGRVDLATMTRSRAANVRAVSAADSNDND
ncbi:MAG: hypothetical protein QOD94_963 [Alphaproteobacteria bacterium]|nr:hypothetical protein [Alphaproteobacteria bacterium]